MALERAGGGGYFVDFLFRGVTSVDTSSGFSDSCTGDRTEEPLSNPWKDGRGSGDVCGGGNGDDCGGGGGGGEFLGCGGGGAERSGGGNCTEFLARKSLFTSCSARIAACDCS